MTYDDFLQRAVISVATRHPHLTAEQLAETVNRMWTAYERLAARRPECLACSDRGCSACGKGAPR